MAPVAPSAKNARLTAVKILRYFCPNTTKSDSENSAPPTIYLTETLLTQKADIARSITPGNKNARLAPTGHWIAAFILIVSGLNTAEWNYGLIRNARW